MAETYRRRQGTARGNPEVLRLEELKAENFKEMCFGIVDLK
jgi:hypothetical protein